MRGGGVDAGQVVDLLEQIGGPGRNGKYRCPAPDHPDQNPSCSIFTRKDGRTGWRCWSCGARGDLIDLQELMGADKKQALLEAGLIEHDDEFGKKKSKPKKRVKPTNRGDEPPPPEEWPASWGESEWAEAPISPMPEPARLSRLRDAQQASVGGGERARGEQRSTGGKTTRRGADERMSVPELGRVPSDARQQPVAARVQNRGGPPKPGRHSTLRPASGRGRGSHSVPAVGVIKSAPDAKVNSKGLSSYDRRVNGEHRRLFDDWADPWPDELLIMQGVGPASRRIKVSKSDDEFQDIYVARVPARDCDDVLAGWVDRNLEQNVDSRKWMFSAGIAVRCVGAHLLKRSGSENPRPWREIWVVEGHSDWLTCMALHRFEMGSNLPVIGANGTSSMPAVAEVLAAQQAAERLVIVADSDEPGVKSALAASKGWQKYSERKPAVVFGPDKGTDLTDLLRDSSYERLEKCVLHAVKMSKERKAPFQIRVGARR